MRKKNFQKHYDVVFLTNLPSFYKSNLYNRIAEKKKILVVYFENTCSQRNDDFYKGQRNFEYISLGQYRGIKRLLKFISLLRKIKYDNLIIAGWDHLECWAAAFFSSKDKNAVVIESSIFDSVTAGLKGWLKRLFMSRVATAYVSGKLQVDLALSLGFKGQLKITKGVGIFNIIPQPSYMPVDKVTRFIYVGRLSPEKNLVSLIDTFNKLPHLTLNIVGFGPQEKHLKSIAKSNIIFHGAVANADLPKYYCQNEVFVLPSISEPWGLVVEEAMNNGLPVIVSNKVGCIGQVVVEGCNGLVFDISDNDGLIKAIQKIGDVNYYNRLRKNVSEMDFQKIAEEQVNQYISSGD